MSQSLKTLLSGIQPSNQITLGNYIGAIKNFVSLQSQYDCIFLGVDLHSITTRQDPKQLRDQSYFVISSYIASGINPEKALLVLQSHVPEHTQLSWILNCFSYMGELNRMTQFKDKSAKQGQNIGAGLFTYPVLMAADILLYQAHLVPVGADQKQHLELTRDLAERMNQNYSRPLFQVPEVFIPKVGARIMDLQDPSKKMSKSETPTGGAVYLADSDDEIRKKIKRAMTDSGSEITFDADKKPGVSNLLTIQSALTGQSIAEITASYTGKQYGHLKGDTAEIAVTALSPIRKEIEKLMKDTAYLDSLLLKGAEAARTRAQKTLKSVYEAIGFVASKKH